MKRIDKLTDAQTARFGEWSQKWIDTGLSTEPADFDKATEAALKAYALIKKSRPILVVRCASPLGATIAGAVAWKLLREQGASVRDSVWASVWDSVGDSVRDSVRASVGASVGDSVRASVGDSVRASVGDSVWASVWDSVGDSVRASASEGANNYGVDQFWAGWAAYVSFLREACGLELSAEISERADVYDALVKSCGWTWWHENVLAISDRPKEIHRDTAGRLHNPVGPSISYRDDWALHHWHGVTIPAEWTTKDHGLTAASALSWKNIEQRRAACEIIGWDNILGQLSAKTIDADKDPMIGTLVQVTIEGRPENFLRVTCGTGRPFALPVPPDMKSALEANAWTYGYDDANNFKKPEVRT